MEQQYLHKVGEYVSYKNNGICKIRGIITQEFAGLGPKTYYEMEMVFDRKTVIYVPVDSDQLEQGMRHVLSSDEIGEIIADSEQYNEEWTEDGKARAADFEAILNEGDRRRILWMIKMLSLRREEAEQNKKKLYASDARLLSSAEKVITEEFAFVLGIEKEQVLPYIRDEIQKVRKKAQ